MSFYGGLANASGSDAAYCKLWFKILDYIGPSKRNFTAPAFDSHSDLAPQEEFVGYDETTDIKVETTKGNEDVSIRFTWAWPVFEIESRTTQMKRPTRQLSAGFAATVLILLSGHSTIFASMPGDEHWSPEFGWPGTGDIVYSITIHNGRLYASGGRLK